MNWWPLLLVVASILAIFGAIVWEEIQDRVEQRRPLADPKHPSPNPRPRPKPKEERGQDDDRETRMQIVHGLWYMKTRYGSKKERDEI